MKQVTVSFFTVLVLLAVLHIPTAGATTLTFDDISTSSQGLIPNGYGGLNWVNMGYLKPSTAHVGYLNGVVSGDYVAFNSSGAPASALEITALGTFDFNSAYLTAAWNNGLNITVQGFNNGVGLYTQTVVVDTTAPTLFTFNYLGIDTLKFTSFGGTWAGYGGGGTHFAMDNFTYDEPVGVPEVGSLLALLTGLGVLGPAVGVNRTRRHRP